MTTRHAWILATFLFLLPTLGGIADAKETAQPMRLPESLALTPDGKTVIVSWRGDLWRVGPDGRGRRLTFHPAEDRRPHVSPDGRQIAFLSNRTGTEQVHVMPVAGGPPRQVTLHSEGARVYGWFPDGRSLLIRSRRDHHWRRSDRLFRKSLTPEKAPELLFDAACNLAALSPDGKRIAFTREGMTWWRKGYRGPRASQLWLYDIEKATFQRLSDGDHGEMWPLWAPGGDTLYYVGEASGTWNLWALDLAKGTRRQLTRFDDDGVNYPAISADGSRIVFRRLADVHAIDPRGDAAPTKVTLLDSGDPTIEPIERETLKRATDVAFADDAREIAFIAGGDVWVMDTELREPRQITNTPHEERDPVFAPDFASIYFVSDAAGQPDVWKATRADTARHWWQNERFQVERVTKDAAAEYSLTITPDGKNLAFLRDRGDLWIQGLEGSEARKLVSSFAPISYSFAPDASWVAYAKTDADFNSDIWIQPTDGSQPPVNVSVHPDNDRNPAWSPDGKVLAFTGRRWTEESDICYVWLSKQDAETGKRDRTLEKALEKMAEREKEKKKKRGKGRKGRRKDKADGKPAGDPTAAGNAAAARDPLSGSWQGRLSGEAPLPEDGLELTLEITGAPGSYAATLDVVGQFSGAVDRIGFDAEAGRVTFALVTPLGPLSGEGTVSGERMEGTWKIEGVMEGAFELTRREASRTGRTAGADAKSEDDDEGSKKDEPVKVVVDVEGIQERVRRVSIPDTSESGLLWSPDAKRLAFRATIKGAAGLYTIEFPEPGSPKLLTKTRGSDARWLEKGKQIAWLVSGVPATMSGSGKAKSFSFSCRQERHLPSVHGAAFELAWRTMRDRYYDGRLGNRDWDAVKRKYLPLAQQCMTSRELETIVNYMLGELNGSHLGFRASGRSWTRSGWRDETGHLGVLWDRGWEGEGLRVGEVIRGTPAHEERHRLHPGDVVLAIDGRPVGPSTHLDRLLTGDPARQVEIRVRRDGGDTETLHMRPTSYPTVRRRMYDHWVRTTREAVDSKSEGRLGYLHVRGMNWSSFLRFEAELYKVGHGKDGLLIDVRDNGGGFTTDHLLTCLSQPRHAITVPRGGGAGYPQDRMVYAPWHKPIVVLCNQNSFSNAEIFAHAIKSLGRGPVVGVQTAGGVISTGRTNVMGIGSLRMPFRGWYLAKTGEDMELNGCVPDHVVWPAPEDHAKGIDRQLDKAIEVLQAEVAAYAARPKPKLEPASAR